MSFTYEVKKWYSIKESKKEYLWPCENDENRTITLFSSDILTKNKTNGTYMRETGFACFGIHIPKEDVIEHVKDIHLMIV